MGGWEQYFRGGREIHCIYEYVVVVRFSGRKKESLMRQRPELANDCKDIAVYLAQVWKDGRRDDLELLEYEQLYQIWTKEEPVDRPGRSSENVNELLDLYRSYMIVENAETAVELLQLYTDREQ